MVIVADRYSSIPPGPLDWYVPCIPLSSHLPQVPSNRHV